MSTMLSKRNMFRSEPTINKASVFGIFKTKLFFILNLLFLSTALSITVSAVTITPVAVPTATDNDYTRINNAVQSIATGGTITLNGTFNWTETNAAASWALGSDGIASTADDYSIFVPPNRNGVTFTANNLGDATIQGPGDLPTAAFEGVLYFDGSGDNQNWIISKIRFLDFDWTLQMFQGAGGVDSYNNTQIINNYIRMPQDLAVATNPDEVDFQNVGIHYSFGTNQVISNNTIDIPGNSLSDTGNNNSAVNVGMQSNTSGGAVYNGLQITNNTLNVVNAQSADPEIVVGIWENAHAHTSNITVSGNQFLNLSGTNNPTLNRQYAFTITSHSSATTTTTYSNNRIVGARVGFEWLDPAFGADFSANLPVRLISNAVLNGGTAFLVQSKGVADLKFNRIVGNNTAGVNNVDGVVNAENNWWGCNYGPGAGGAGCTGTANGTLGVVDANPWLTLRTTATPNAVLTGGTSNISSNLNVNSDNVTTTGFVPNGTPAAFTATLGTVLPTSGTTTSGVTGTTFTAGAAAGTGGAQTTIDGQTVNAPITITFTCNNVSIPTGTTVSNNTQFLVPLNVDNTTGRNILSYDFTLTYNPAVVAPIAVETTGTLSSGWTITTNNSSGTLVVSGFSSNPLSGSGVLLNIRFISIGGIGTTSNLNLTAFQFNEGVPCVNTSNGNVTIISGTVSGRVTYVNAPTTTAVPNTTINAAGSIPLSTTTDINGLYSLSGFGAGAYTITPSKANQVNGITNFDATRIAQHVVGFITLNATQLIAADVSGNGTVTSLDAAYIAQYIALIPNPSFTGTWRFIPANRSYPNVDTSQTNQDYSAILLGEVTGNWNPAGPLRPELSSPVQTTREDKTGQIVAVNAPVSQAAEEKTAFTVNLTATDTTNEGISGYQFDLLYNSEVIEPHAIPCDVAGTISNSLTATCHAAEPGVLKVVLFGTTPISGKGTLLKLKFNVVGATGSTSPLTIRNFMFNEGVPQDVTTDGQISVTDSTTNAVSISGQLFTANGQSIDDEIVILTNSKGETSSVRSNNVGFYQFNGVLAGEKYTINVWSERYKFAPQVVNVTGAANSINLFANH